MKLKAENPLGKTGIWVPSVIYGTSYLGNLYRELDFNQKLKLMSTWFECTEKPVVIDTAGKYGAGLALEVIGKGLSELGVDPGDIIISNKMGWYKVELKYPEPLFEPGVWKNLRNDAVQSFGYSDIIKCFEQGSLLLGGTYRTDLVSVHDPDEYLHAADNDDTRKKRYDEILESYRALFDLKKKGEVRAVGIGCKNWEVVRELYEDVKFDWVMFANSFTIYKHPYRLVTFMDRLNHDGVGIINSAIFHGGFLTGGSSYDYREVDPGSSFGKTIYGWRIKFNTICNKFNVDPAEACIHFAISHPSTVSIALNTSKPGKMKQNAEILQKKIADDFWSELKNAGIINRDYRYL